MAQGGSAFIFLLDAATRSEQLPRVKTALSKLEGVQQVIEPSDFAALCLPTPTENHEAPDLILAIGSVVSFNGDLTGDVIGLATETYRRTHGHLPQPAYMHTTFIAAGTGIRSGVKLKSINNTDVAPTIARLLRLKLDDADGESLILNPAVDYYALGRMRPSTT